MVADQIALARALGGGQDALLVAHDWGAVGAWGALSRAPELWGRAVILNIPPFEIFGENLVTYPQIKKSFYFWYFQMLPVIEDRIRQDDFAFIRDIWGDWSPGYEAKEDVGYVAQALADPDHLRAALGYYWGQFEPARFGSPEWAGEQAAAWAGNVPAARPLPPRNDRRLSRHEPASGRPGPQLRRVRVGGRAHRGCRTFHAGGAARGDQPADH